MTLADLGEKNALRVAEQLLGCLDATLHDAENRAGVKLASTERGTLLREMAYIQKQLTSLERRKALRLAEIERKREQRKRQDHGEPRDQRSATLIRERSPSVAAIEVTTPRASLPSERVDANLSAAWDRLPQRAASPPRFFSIDALLVNDGAKGHFDGDSADASLLAFFEGECTDLPILRANQTVPNRSAELVMHAQPAAGLPSAAASTREVLASASTEFKRFEGLHSAQKTAWAEERKILQETVAEVQRERDELREQLKLREQKCISLHVVNEELSQKLARLSASTTLSDHMSHFSRYLRYLSVVASDTSHAKALLFAEECRAVCFTILANASFTVRNLEEMQRAGAQRRALALLSKTWDGFASEEGEKTVL
jgi:hypothetical protein